MTDAQNKAAIALSVVVTLLVVVTAGPFFTIWSLNTLFGLEIGYTFKTWCAVLWLLTLFHGIRVVVRSSN